MTLHKLANLESSDKLQQITIDVGDYQQQMDTIYIFVFTHSYAARNNNGNNRKLEIKSKVNH